MADARVAGTRVVERDHGPPAAQLVQRGDKDVVVLDGRLLGDLDDQIGQRAVVGQNRLDLGGEHCRRAEVDRQEAVDRQLVVMIEHRRECRCLQTAGEAAPRGRREPLLRPGVDVGVGYPGQPLEPAHGPAREVHDRLEASGDEALPANATEGVCPIDGAGLEHRSTIGDAMSMPKDPRQSLDKERTT